MARVTQPTRHLFAPGSGNASHRCSRCQRWTLEEGFAAWHWPPMPYDVMVLIAFVLVPLVLVLIKHLL